MKADPQPVLARLRQHLQANPQHIALARSMGFRFSRVERGEATVEIETGPEHFNPMDTLHGGVICTIADTAMGMAHASTLLEGESWTTLELKINFLSPVRKDKLRAVAKVTREGRTVSLVECEVLNEAGKLVAKASSTCMTLRGEMAEGREPRR